MHLFSHQEFQVLQPVLQVPVRIFPEDLFFMYIFIKQTRREENF